MFKEDFLEAIRTKNFKYFCQLIWKWGFCSWIHKKELCYPECWDRGLDGPWHCAKCHPCSEGLDEILKTLK